MRRGSQGIAGKAEYEIERVRGSFFKSVTKHPRDGKGIKDQKDAREGKQVPGPKVHDEAAVVLVRSLE